MNQINAKDNQEAASAGGGGDADFYVAAVGAPPSSRGAAITQGVDNQSQLSSGMIMP